MSTHHRSKTFATWLAVLAGPLGLHRLYVHGLADVPAWLHLPPTLLGVVGLIRIVEHGQDDRVAWVLLPLLGLMIAQAMLVAIVWGLTPDDRWDARHNPGHPVTATGWGPVIGVITALLVGAAALMSSLAYGIQKFFEWDTVAAATSAKPLAPPTRAAAPARRLVQIQPGSAAAPASTPEA